MARTSGTMRGWRWTARLAPPLAVIVSFACAETPVAPIAGDAGLVLQVSGMPGYVRKIRLAISGPGIRDSMVFDLVPQGGTIADTVRVPSGTDRHVVANAFDSVGINTHRGDTTLTLNPGMNATLRLSMQPLDAELPIVITFGDSLIWSEDFESYALASWPSAWVPDGNGTSTAQNYVDGSVFLGGSQSLRLYGVVGGCWASIAYRPITVSPPFEIEVAVRNGNENLSGCNQFRAELHLRQCCTWSNPQRGLVRFTKGGTVLGGVNYGDSLAAYSPLTWYRLRIRYERTSSSTVTLSYWLDGQFLGSRVTPVVPGEDNLGHLELTVIEGSAWFDDVRVYK